VVDTSHQRDGRPKVTIVPVAIASGVRPRDVFAGRRVDGVERPLVVLCLAASFGVLACSGSDGSDDRPPTLDRIDGPAQVDPSFDPFATDPSVPPVTARG
jgi:hypothetical protein